MSATRRTRRPGRPVRPAATARISRNQWLLLSAAAVVLAGLGGALWFQSRTGPREGWFGGAHYPQQGLPAADVRIGELPLRVEVARADDQVKIGMMGRRDVPAGTGMLFVFPDARERHFWMKNCPVDLDLAFFDADRRLLNLTTMAAWDTDRSKYASAGPARYAIETRAGYLREKGVKAGDELHLPESILKQPQGNDD